MYEHVISTAVTPMMSFVGIRDASGALHCVCVCVCVCVCDSVTRVAREADAARDVSGRSGCGEHGVRAGTAVAPPRLRAHLKDKAIHAEWDRADKDGVQRLVIVRALGRADVDDLPFQVWGPLRNVRRCLGFVCVCEGGTRYR